MSMKHLKWIGLVLLFALGISSALFAQDPSVLLEKAIYTEETLGNLEDAIGIYQQVTAATDADREISSLALFRLGMCYQKSGRTNEAQAAFAKLSRLYPERRDLISKIPDTSSSQLALRPAPWVDGELLKLAIKVRSGQQAGTQFYRVESTQESGKMLWKLLSVQGALSLSQFTTVLMDAPTFAPISSKTFNYAGEEYQALYGPQQVAYITTRSGSSNKRQLSLDQPTFDNEQLAYLLRCLPLREKFQITIPISNSSSASVLDGKIAVMAREEVTVPAGTFDCYKTNVTQGTQEQTYWISADANSYIVKEARSGTLILELSSVEIAEKGRSVPYQDRQHGISLEAPAGWFVSGLTMRTEHLIHLIGPEGEADCMLLFVDPPQGESAQSSLDENVDKIIASGQRLYSDYVVRPESRGYTTVSGLQAVRFIADYKAFGPAQKKAEYVFDFVSASREFEFRFRTSPENFDRSRPAFDSIISSVRVQ
jgi:hypothetical protein